MSEFSNNSTSENDRPNKQTLFLPLLFGIVGNGVRVKVKFEVTVQLHSIFDHLGFLE